jgi:penicillin-binding protein 1A
MRLVMILVGLATLAGVSTVFGMMMAVASDLPQLENFRQYRDATRNSFLYDDQGHPIGILASPQNVVLDRYADISPWMRRAIVSVEDRRYWSESGVDLRGLARAFISNVGGGPKEGASTIAEQFVKNALAEEDNRTIFEKLREAVLAYHLAREWKKEKILQEYLNSIYFGHGAYGVESAARVFFGKSPNIGFNENATPADSGHACGDANAADPHLPTCALRLAPWQAALLAGMVANPTEFDPVAHPVAARDRRNLVLRDMYQQHYLTHAEYDTDIDEPLPIAADIQQPQQPPAAPYFTSWVEPQIIRALEREGVPAKLAAYRAYYGGLKIKTTIDLSLQNAAQRAVDAEFPPDSGGPTASLVAIDNHTGQVRAMVSGSNNYAKTPFNLATEGLRQPGSSFKMFTLASALSTGDYGPDSVIDSHPLDVPFRAHGVADHFVVHNFGNSYSGPISLAAATAISDNTVFAQVGLHLGTGRIRRMAKAMGIRTPISTNPSMILGGLRTGVSTLDMAHAYETVATGGLKVYDPKLGDVDQGPTGIASISGCQGCPQSTVVDHPVYKRVLSPEVAATIHQMLQGVVSSGGTAPLAAIPGVDVVGKTGTTSNYVDAWFVGWTPQMTVAVWVGYPDRAIPMTTTYNGGPVEGGTFPAVIFRDFMEQALGILAQERAAAAAHHRAGATPTGTTTAPLLTGTGATPPATTSTATSTTPAGPGTSTAPTGGGTATPHGTGGTGGGGGTTGGGGGTTGAAGGGTTGAGTGGGTTGGGTGGGTTGGGTAGGTTGGGTGGGTGGTGGGSTGGSGGAGLGGG